jgi:hypothetical protein
MAAWPKAAVGPTGPVLVDAKIDVGCREQRRREPGLCATTHHFAHDVVHLDQPSALKIAEHRGREWRNLRSRLHSVIAPTPASRIHFSHIAPRMTPESLPPIGAPCIN